MTKAMVTAFIVSLTLNLISAGVYDWLKAADAPALLEGVSATMAHVARGG